MGWGFTSASPLSITGGQKLSSSKMYLNIGDKGSSPSECGWYYSHETTVENLHVTSQSNEVPNRYFQDQQFRKLTIQH